METRQV